MVKHFELRHKYNLVLSKSFKAKGESAFALNQRMTPPFKPSRLMIGLSLCLLVPLTTSLQAHAASTEENESVRNKTANNNIAQNNVFNSTRNGEAVKLNDDQLEEALIALKLKQAVENGLVDASVLEDYKRETLNLPSSSKNNPKPKPSTSKPEKGSSSDVADLTEGLNQDANEQNSVKTDSNHNSINDDRSSDNKGSGSSTANNRDSIFDVTHNSKEGVISQNLDDSHGDNLSSDNSNSGRSNSEDSYNNSDFNSNSDTNHYLDIDDDSDIEIETAIDDGIALQTPQEIEQALAQIDAEVDMQFDAPVATLDAKDPPIGFDANSQSVFKEPTNLETLGILQPSTTQVSSNQVSSNQFNSNNDTATKEPINQLTQNNKSDQSPETEAISSEAVSSETMVTDASGSDRPADEDLTNTHSINDEPKNNDIMAERVNEAEEQSDITADAAGINPDEYLPDYKGNNSEGEATAKAVADSADDASSAKNDVGFFKGLYNRLFRGGYAPLPRIDANVYIQDVTRRDASGQPLLVKADKDDQPARNISAALENITVEAISDFTAALPKLREEALNAAHAVGYYDINLRFNRADNDTVDVIIEQLGEPVIVNSRVIDIRGDGKDLPEFEAIVKSAPPKEGDVFNQGAYKNIKTAIETTKERFGFFDGRWLNKSVDVILPDNTADIDLIYDTAERYHFDEVVFFTIDEETGELTLDPDKLPVKPKLLHQLYDFEAGDAFYQPLITNFTNDLSATRYFNMVNVETIKPKTGINDNGSLDFENASNTDDRKDDVNAQANDTLSILSGLDDRDSKSAQQNASTTLSADTNNVEATDSSAVNDNPTDTDAIISEVIDADADSEELNVQKPDETSINSDNDNVIQPIEFSIDQQTSERLQVIQNKAERLSRLPDDRVLDEENTESKSILGKISNAISNTVKKILPDEEEEPVTNAEALNSEASRAVLEAQKTPQQVAETKKVPLYVFVMADKPKDVDLGIGYGTDTGVRAVARLEHNLINRDGYQAGVSVGASRINKTVSLHASRPWKHPLDDRLLADLTYEQELIDQGTGNLDLSTNTLKTGIAREIHSDNGWNRTYSLRYRLDELESGVSDIDREDLPIPFNRKDSKFTQQALLLGYAIDRTSADNLLNPTKGWHQYYSIEAGSDSVLTDTNMAIVRAGVNGLYSFGEFDKHQVLGSLNAGYIWADDFEDVPYKLRFFAGGDRSIRGYDYNSLSTLENGYLVGGQVLAVGSAEYNYEFKPGFRGAVFADAGNAYDKDFETETKLGVGFGIRWASPVGMVRVDLAAGVLEDSIPIRLHFFIGSPLQ